MGTNFLLPIQLTAGGSFATTSDPDQIALQRVESVIGTPPGERVMMPDYGVNLPGYLFAPGLDDTISQAIAVDVSNQLGKWEPNINVLDIVPVISQNDVGIANVNVEFTTSLSPDFTPIQTATVLVGGTVVND